MNLICYSGKTDVKGEGIIVTLTDTDEQSIEAKDLLVLVNELRVAGAEAISINDERVINMTDIVDISTRYILVNSQKVVSPYIVKAIGDKTYLQSALSIKSGYIDLYTQGYGKNITLETKKEINILRYDAKGNTDKMVLKYIGK